MAITDSADSEKPPQINRLAQTAQCDELLPSTTIDHLLSEDQARQAESDRREIDALGEILNRASEKRALYPGHYDQAKEMLDSGMSHEQIRVELADVVIACDSATASIIMEAYEDALAGRAPKHYGGWNWTKGDPRA